MNREELYQKIGRINDPDLNIPFNELGAIKKVELNGSNLDVELRLVGPLTYAQQSIKEAIQNEIGNDYNLNLEISEIELDNSNRQFLKGAKHIIAVASGKGGVGKSALAGNIAATLTRMGAKVGLLDGDVYGPSQPTMFGLKDARLEAETDSHGKTVAVPVEKEDGLKIASMGFVMNSEEAAIVRGPMLASYFSLLFEQIEWGDLDFLIFDLPPGTGDIQLTLVQKVPLSGAVVVTTPQEIALADVRRSIAMFKKVNVDILGIIENMSYFSPEDMPEKKYYIFGKDGGKVIAYESDVPLLGQIPLDIEMREANDGGEPVALSGRSPRQVEIIKDTTIEMLKSLRNRNYNNLNNSLEINI